MATALRAAFPGSHIAWAVDPRFAEVIRSCTAVDEVLTFKPGLKPSTWPVFAQPYDLALDMQGLFKSGITVHRSRARKRLGYHWQREGSWFFSARVLPDPSSLHVVDQYVDVARAAGARVDRADFGLAPRTEGSDQAESLLLADGLLDKFVLLNAGAGWASKRWPPESFAKVIAGLQSGGVSCVLIGGPDTAARAAGDAVLAGCAEKPTDLIGRTSVAGLIALISRCAAHVGGDTGSTHIAAALSVPAIGLYCVTRPERCCPYGQIENTHYNPFGLDRIPHEDVLENLWKVLSK